MSESREADPQYLLERDTPIRYAVNELGVSRDIAYLDLPLSLTILGASLAERRMAPAAQPARETLSKRHHDLATARLLPPHLRDKQAFIQRAHELVGKDNAGFLKSEVVAAIDATRHKHTTKAYRQFEFDIALLYSQWLEGVMAHSPKARRLFRHGTVVVDHEPQGFMLRTGDDLCVQLPKQHCGIIHCAPTVPDAIIRIEETQMASWKYTALLGSRAFNAAFAHNYAAGNAVPSNQVLATGSGLIKGIEALQSTSQELPGLQRRFGAMVLSAVLHLDAEEISHAIRAAPSLLAPGGILLISDVEYHTSTQRSVWQIIQQASAVFGHPPDILGLMTEDIGHQQGRQAAFINYP